jgi:hypothetical protein
MQKSDYELDSERKYPVCQPKFLSVVLEKRPEFKA